MSCPLASVWVLSSEKPIGKERRLRQGFRDMAESKGIWEKMRWLAFVALLVVLALLWFCFFYFMLRV